MKVIASGHATHDCYNYICKYALAHQGNTPSLRQIGTGCGFSCATAHYHIQVLIKQGMLERIDGELCVVRATFALTAGARDFSDRHAYPQIMAMKVIPKDMRAIDPDMMEAIGIRTDGAADDEFFNASYPPGWYFEPLPNSGDDAYLLVDDRGKYRALLTYNKKQYRPHISFLE